MRYSIYTALFLFIAGFALSQQKEGSNAVGLEQTEWIFPLDEQMIEQVAASMKESKRDLSSLFAAYGVEFTDGSTITVDSDKRVLRVKTDHESARRVMLVLYQIHVDLSDLGDREGDHSFTPLPKNKKMENKAEIATPNKPSN